CLRIVAGQLRRQVRVEAREDAPPMIAPGIIVRNEQGKHDDDLLRHVLAASQELAQEKVIRRPDGASQIGPQLLHRLARQIAPQEEERDHERHPAAERPEHSPERCAEQSPEPAVMKPSVDAAPTSPTRAPSSAKQSKMVTMVATRLPADETDEVERPSEAEGVTSTYRPRDSSVTLAVPAGEWGQRTIPRSEPETACRD